MHNVKAHGNQAGGTPRGCRYREKIAIFAVIESIQDAVEDLEQGRVVEVAASLRDLAQSLLDDARAQLADLRSLSQLQPIHEINAALSARRRTILEKRAEAEGWNFRWDGDAFEVADTDAAFWLTVDPSDNWQASPSGSPEELVSDSGLLALITFFKGTSVAEEASRCAAWIQEGGRK